MVPTQTQQDQEWFCWGIFIGFSFRIFKTFLFSLGARNWWKIVPDRDQPCPVMVTLQCGVIRAIDQRSNCQTWSDSTKGHVLSDQVHPGLYNPEQVYADLINSLINNYFGSLDYVKSILIYSRLCRRRQINLQTKLHCILQANLLTPNTPFGGKNIVFREATP